MSGSTIAVVPHVGDAEVPATSCERFEPFPTRTRLQRTS